MSSNGSDVCPPFGVCRVCQAPATGHHYGAVTCEACKGFFKRAETTSNVNKDGQQGSAWQNYQCYEGGDCLINIKERARCRKCRYEKCIKVGMSLDCVYPGKRWNRNFERFITKPRTFSHLAGPEAQSSASFPDERTTVRSIYMELQHPLRCNSAEEPNAQTSCDYSAQMSTAERHIPGYSVQSSWPAFSTASLRPFINAPVAPTNILRSELEADLCFPSKPDSLEEAPVSNRVSVIVYARKSV